MKDNKVRQSVGKRQQSQTKCREERTTKCREDIKVRQSVVNQLLDLGNTIC